jgi:acetolactate synthase small subunit
VLTGNEELVISLTGENKITRGHVKVIGLADLKADEAACIVRQEIPSVSQAEIQKITTIFGGFIHDVQAVSREVQSQLSHTENRAKGL